MSFFVKNNFLMRALLLTPKVQFLYIQNLVVIPTIFQMLHIHLDSQLWKFSATHNREHVLKHLSNY